jgi:predicted nucleotidyltransferase
MTYLSKLLDQPLRPEEVNRLSKDLCAKILSLCTPRKIILFGSAARGKMFPSSDLDVCIVLDTALEAEKVRSVLVKAPPLIAGHAVDFLFYEEQEFAERATAGGVCEIIAREGVTLYTCPS